MTRRTGATARKRPARAWLMLALALGVACRTSGAASTDRPAAIRVEVTSHVMVRDVPRIGVNLGTWHMWGAEQLGANVLHNPGFEGVIDRAIVIVRTVLVDGFTDDDTRVARPAGFWRGAAFEVRTGASAGARGTVRDSLGAGDDGLPLYRTEGPPPALAPGDVIALTRTDDRSPPERWHVSAAVAPALDSTCPGSPGVRSLLLPVAADRPADVVAYIDAIGARAGKLLPIGGRWQLAFWSRGEGRPLDLAVRFARQGTAPFVERRLSPAAEWRRTVLEFDGRDDGPPGTLELRFKLTGEGRVWLDDVELRRLDESVGEFRPAVTAALRLLRPGYLRDWQGGQGTTLANRLADPLARRMTRSSPRLTDTFFEYGLADFLDLCRRVEAAPWIVVPTTFSDAEWTGLGAFLARNAATFREVVVEFGNENWNRLSRPTAIAHPAAHGAAAERAFRLLRQGAGPQRPLLAAVNGQFVNPSAALAFAAAAPQADLLAVAPYFLFRLPAGWSPATRLAALHPDDSRVFGALADGVRARQRELAVYEVNAHTTAGDAPPAERDPTVAGAAAGSALARRLLDAQAAGARRMCAYALAGYDMWTDDRRGFVKLWGVVRDLGATGRVRPTGLAVRLLNEAMRGDRVDARVAPASPDLSVAAYHADGQWAVVLASGRATPVQVEVAFPGDVSAAVPTRVLSLVAPDPWTTNEDGEAVRLRETTVQPIGARMVVDVPPAGLVALVPARPGADG